MRGQKQAHSSARTSEDKSGDSWRTPEPVLERVRALGPIMLDPCSNADNSTGAVVSYSGPDGNGLDGLAEPWPARGEGLTFSNHPYSEGGPWAAKIATEASQGCSIAALVPSRTDTAWWRKMTQGDCLVGFYRKRITFELPPWVVPLLVTGGDYYALSSTAGCYKTKPTKKGPLYVEWEKSTLFTLHAYMEAYPEAIVADMPLAPAPFPSAMIFHNLDEGLVRSAFGEVCDLYRKV